MQQHNRPAGMKYFDLVMSEVHGLRIKELLDAKKQGQKVVGAFCAFVPEEIVLAFDGVMVGLCAGAEFATTEAEKFLPRNTCALIKGFFGFALARVCPYLAASDLVVTSYAVLLRLGWIGETRWRLVVVDEAQGIKNPGAKQTRAVKALKTDARIHDRARRVTAFAWWGTAGMTVIITLLAFRLQPQVPANLAARPWGYVFPALAVAGLLGVWWFVSRREEAKAVLASSAYLVGMLCSVAFGLYPFVLPSVQAPSLGLTARSAAAGEPGLRIGLGWWIPGLVLVVIYFVYTYRRFSGKVALDRGGGY